jgi:hypothetical protein
LVPNVAASATLRQRRALLEKLHHLQAIVRAERVDERARHAPRLLQGLAVHGAARVEQEDEIARHRLALRGGRGRHDGEQAVRVHAVRPVRSGARREERDAHARLHDRPAHHDVAIEPRALVDAHRDRPAGSVAGRGAALAVIAVAGAWIGVARHAHRVRRRLGRAPRRERVEDGAREREARGDGAVGHVLRHALRVGHAALLAHVAGRDDRGKAPLPRSLVEPAQRLIHGDLRDDGLAGRDVADLLREQARSILLQQRGAAPFDERAIVLGARDLALLHLARDAAAAEVEREARHRAVRRQRQAVRDRQRLRVRVLEALLDDGARDAAAGLGVEARAGERQLAAVGGDEARAAGGGGGDGRRHDEGEGHGRFSGGLCATNGGAPTVVTKKILGRGG